MDTPVSGRSGYIWHARFLLHGREGIEPATLWNDYEISRPRTKNSIIYVCANNPNSIDISFSAVDNPQAIADSISDCFDAVLNAQRHGVNDDDDSDDATAGG